MEVQYSLSRGSVATDMGIVCSGGTETSLDLAFMEIPHSTSCIIYTVSDTPVVARYHSGFSIGSGIELEVQLRETTGSEPGPCEGTRARPLGTVDPLEGRTHTCWRKWFL